MLGDLARSEFEEVRARFAPSLSIDNATPDIVRALKGMIITGTETIPLASAILALMELHGFPYDPFDRDHRTLYQALHSD